MHTWKWSGAGCTAQYGVHETPLSAGAGCLETHPALDSDQEEEQQDAAGMSLEGMTQADVRQVVDSARAAKQAPTAEPDSKRQRLPP